MAKLILVTATLIALVLIGVGLRLLIRRFNWVKDNVDALQFVVAASQFAIIFIGGGLALYKYWHEQSESRRIAAKETAVQHLVVDGFLLAASEIETAGQQVTFAYMSLMEEDVQDPKAYLLMLRNGWLGNDCCRQMVYGSTGRLAGAVSRIQMTDDAAYYVIMNVYAELCHWMSFVTLYPPDVVFASPQSLRNIKNVVDNYYIFGHTVATKAAEIFVNDEHLTLRAGCFRKNKDFNALTGICRDFMQKHKAYVAQSDQKTRTEKLMELNEWMRQMTGDDGKLKGL